MINSIEGAAEWAADPAPDLHGSDDAHLFADSRRRIRIRPDAPGLVAAVHRDGRRYLLEMPHEDIAGLTSQKFAAELFGIADRYAKTAARGTTPGGRSTIKRIFVRLAKAVRNTTERAKGVTPS